MAEAPLHVLKRIRSSYQQFSEKEKQIADYIISEPEKIVHSSINQVADDLKVADATVFRFCKRLGFKGYQALKIALASELVSPIKDIHEEINEKDSEMDIMKKVFQANINAIEYTREIQNEKNFTKALDIITNAKQIHFYGNGGSGVAALDGQHKFMRSGLPSHAYTDTHLQLMAASQLTNEDAALFISHTGTNKDLLEVVDVAKQNGVPTIGITNYAKSPFSKAVDVSLYTVSPETGYRSEALASRLAELSIIDALYVNYSVKRKEQSQEAMAKMRKAISRKRL
ncbi:RpiR family transcriptional regulator [Thalassobacillus devorans]|uniref:RpiR family transcriptional regulator n=1 Tax=Thalassobacillus devorans TaxID=279813 RepID=A0ABQ1NYN8_9BACI|nr:MurR/RpiR family transcriptional regulator [Thalassobacillus devorans]NIK28518.1 DNA-binding MurR/RpiR family transcriptional regulator [Thalassobacillus devorans]GGC85609.1 RpiR family transcriptional regulator [Thalassobacillus devorans]